MKNGRGLVLMCLLAVLCGAMPGRAQQAASSAPAKTTGAEYLAQGDQFMAGKDYSKALAKYMMAWLEMPDNPAVVHRVGDLYVATGRDAGATRFYAAAIRMNPSYEDPIINLARAYLRVNRPEQAAALLTDSARLEAFAESPRYQHVLGLMYMRIAQYDKAIAALQKAAELVPAHGPYFGDLGNAYYLAKRYRDAVAAYDTALSLQPNDAIASLNRSMALEKLDRIPDAVSALEAYVSLANLPEEHQQRKRLAALKAKVANPATAANAGAAETP